MKKVSVTLPDSLAEELRQLAEKERRTLSVTIELLLAQAVAKRPAKRVKEPAVPPLLALVDPAGHSLTEEDSDAPTAA